MDLILYPHKLSGILHAIPSKSQAHRLLICAAFADRHTTIYCPQVNDDICATAQCLRSLGVVIEQTAEGFEVDPLQDIPDHAELYCGESGSTLRFMLPIVAALGVDAVFHMEGRLPLRPLSPLWETMEEHGVTLTRPTSDTIRCTGALQSGRYQIAGNVSSQYITGLLFALSVLPGKSTLVITGEIESAPYIHMTLQCLMQFGVQTDLASLGNQRPFHSPAAIQVEGDWSNAAFFVAANAIGNQIEISGLQTDSLQGDKAVASIVADLKHNVTISGEDIPDLIPILAVVAGANQGASFLNIGRLRLKESDRIASTSAMMRALGITVEDGNDFLHVFPGKYHGCTIDACNDHRIAMAAAIASTVASGPVIILGADCVKKSYPSFWQEFQRLGGYYEQYIR